MLLMINIIEWELTSQVMTNITYKICHQNFLPSNDKKKNSREKKMFKLSITIGQLKKKNKGGIMKGSDEC